MVWIFASFWGFAWPTKKSELRDCFTASLLNGSLVFFCQVKNHIVGILMVLLANLTSYNEWAFTYFFNK